MIGRRVATVLALAALAGCSSGSKPTPTPTAPTTSASPTVVAIVPGVASDAATGFSVKLPEGYVQITPTTTLAQVQAAGATGTQVAAILKAEQPAIGKATIFAVDFDDSTAGLAENLNVVVQDAGTLTDVRGNVAKIVPQLEAAGLKVSSHKNVTAAGQPGLEIQYSFNTGTTIEGTQFYFLRKGKLFVVTLGQHKRDAATVSAVLSGLHFTS